MICDKCGEDKKKVFYVIICINSNTFGGYTNTGSWCVSCLKGMMQPNGYGNKRQVTRVAKLVTMTREDWEE